MLPPQSQQPGTCWVWGLEVTQIIRNPCSKTILPAGPCPASLLRFMHAFIINYSGAPPSPPIPLHRVPPHRQDFPGTETSVCLDRVVCKCQLTRPGLITVFCPEWTLTIALFEALITWFVCNNKINNHKPLQSCSMPRGCGELITTLGPWPGPLIVHGSLPHFITCERRHSTQPHAHLHSWPHQDPSCPYLN